MRFITHAAEYVKSMALGACTYCRPVAGVPRYVRTAAGVSLTYRETKSRAAEYVKSGYLGACTYCRPVARATQYVRRAASVSLTYRERKSRA